jgi:hypothetical protein
MRRLLRFFALLTLWVLALVTVIAWGAGQVGSMGVTAPFGGSGVDGGILSDGWGVGIIYRWSMGVWCDTELDALTLREAFHCRESVVGDHLWFDSDDGHVLIGVSYILTLFLLFAIYTTIWFFSRRR